MTWTGGRPAPSYEEFLQAYDPPAKFPDQKTLGCWRWAGGNAWIDLCKVQKSSELAKKKLHLIAAKCHLGKIVHGPQWEESSDDAGTALISSILGMSKELYQSVKSAILLLCKNSPLEFDEWFGDNSSAPISVYINLLDELPHPPPKEKTPSKSNDDDDLLGGPKAEACELADGQLWIKGVPFRLTAREWNVLEAIGKHGALSKTQLGKHSNVGEDAVKVLKDLGKQYPALQVRTPGLERKGGYWAKVKLREAPNS